MVPCGGVMCSKCLTNHICNNIMSYYCISFIFRKCSQQTDHRMSLSQIPTKLGMAVSRGLHLQRDQNHDRWRPSELLRVWSEIRKTQFKGKEASPSVGVDQACQTKHAAAQWGGTVALQFVKMQCTTACLCATGGWWKGSGAVWCIFLCLHDRISYMVTTNSWLKVTGEL